MKRAAPLVTTLAIAAGLSAGPALSRTPLQGAGVPPCKHWREIAHELASRYAERPVAFGLQSNGNLLQVFVSEATGTWTLVTMHPNGTACLVGAGNGWETLPKPNTDPEACGHPGRSRPSAPVQALLDLLAVFRVVGVQLGGAATRLRDPE